jgi:hypothetical protein
VWNLDESSVWFEQEDGKRGLGPVGEALHIGCTKHVGRATCSVIIALSASGDVAPPWVGFKRKSVGPFLAVDRLHSTAEERAVVMYAESGMLSTASWLKYFAWLLSRIPSPALILLDALSLHHSPASQALAAQYNATIIAIPRRCTWLLQPVDCGVTAFYKAVIARGTELLLHRQTGSNSARSQRAVMLASIEWAHQLLRSPALIPLRTASWTHTGIAAALIPTAPPVTLALPNGLFVTTADAFPQSQPLTLSGRVVQVRRRVPVPYPVRRG